MSEPTEQEINLTMLFYRTDRRTAIDFIRGWRESEYRRIFNEGRDSVLLRVQEY